MSRSTKESWLESPGDLKEDVVEDVPFPGESVKIRSLPASFSGKLQQQLNFTLDGRQEVGGLDLLEVQTLQFSEGVIEPKFSVDEARTLQDKFGPAFMKVLEAINRISQVDEEAITEADKRFPAGGERSNGQGRGELGAVPEVAEGSGVGPDLGA